MPTKPKPQPPIKTILSGLPKRCPALWDAILVWAYESNGVTRLTCPKCGWTERYLVIDAV